MKRKNSVNKSLFVLVLVLASRWQDPALSAASEQPCASDNWWSSCCSSHQGGTHCWFTHPELITAAAAGKLQESPEGSCLTAVKSLRRSGLVTVYLHTLFWKQGPSPLSVAVRQSCPANWSPVRLSPLAPTAAPGHAAPRGAIAAVLALVTLGNTQLLPGRAASGLLSPAQTHLQEDEPAKPCRSCQGWHGRPIQQSALKNHRPHQRHCRHPCLRWGAGSEPPLPNAQAAPPASRSGQSALSAHPRGGGSWTGL